MMSRQSGPHYSFRADLKSSGARRCCAEARATSVPTVCSLSRPPPVGRADFTARLSFAKPVKVDCFVNRVEPGHGMGVPVTLSEEQHKQNYQDLLNSLSSSTP